MLICILTKNVITSCSVLLLLLDRKSGSAGMPRPISYAVFCLKKKKNDLNVLNHHVTKQNRNLQCLRKLLHGENHTGIALPGGDHHISRILPASSRHFF